MLQWMLQCCYCDTMNVSVVTVLQDSIMDASEESQLEAAIRLSLAESTKNTRPECDLNVLSDDDDSDDDIPGDIHILRLRHRTPQTVVSAHEK